MASYDMKIAPTPKDAFSTSAAYEPLDIVSYGGKAYIFKVAKDAGAWDVTKVMEICSDGIDGTNGTNGLKGNTGVGISGITFEPSTGKITVTTA